MAKSLMRPVASPVRLDGLSPVEVAGRLRHLDGLVFFDTAGNFPAGSSLPVSVIAANPVRVLRGNVSHAQDLEGVRMALADSPKPAGDPGFPVGGLCGWIDYEGDFVFGDYPEMLVYSHNDQSWWETGNLSGQLRESSGSAEISPFTPLAPCAKFTSDVARIKEWIAAGHIYQANLSQGFVATVSGDLFGLYETLRDASPAPMAAYLNLDGREILSSSPESFLKISGRGIETRPIKGTRPRFADPDEDRRSAYELQTSAKEVAELIMITDLLRNDLGQICEFGSVQVAEMLRLESLAQVHHLVSTVTGTLRPDIDAIAAIAACFPGGSITGAPKKRAMEILNAARIELKHSPGFQSGILIVDNRGWVFTPVAHYLEEEPKSDETPNAIELSPAQVTAFAIRFSPVAREEAIKQAPTPEIAAEIADMPCDLGFAPVEVDHFAEVKKAIEIAPPVKFDVIRQVRVFEPYLQYVEMSLTGAAIQKHSRRGAIVRTWVPALHSGVVCR